MNFSGSNAAPPRDYWWKLVLEGLEAHQYGKSIYSSKMKSSSEQGFFFISFRRFIEKNPNHFKIKSDFKLVVPTKIKFFFKFNIFCLIRFFINSMPNKWSKINYHLYIMINNTDLWKNMRRSFLYFVSKFICFHFTEYHKYLLFYPNSDLRLSRESK